jgi:hypothetical protein
MHDGIHSAGNENKIRDIMTNECEVAMAGKVTQVVWTSGNKVIHPNHFVPFLQ